MIVHAVIDKDGQKHTPIVVVDGAADEYVTDGHAFGLEAAGGARVDEQVRLLGLHGQVRGQRSRNRADL